MSQKQWPLRKFFIGINLFRNVIPIKRNLCRSFWDRKVVLHNSAIYMCGDELTQCWPNQSHFGAAGSAGDGIRISSTVLELSAGGVLSGTPCISEGS